MPPGTPLPVLDLHLHLAASDPGDANGSWFSEKRRKSLVFRWIRRKAGLPAKDEGFDVAFRQLLASAISEASALARAEGFSGFQAVGLAFDVTRNERGSEMTAETDFFVSNQYALRLAAEKDADHIPGLLAGLSIHPCGWSASRMEMPEALELAKSQGAALVKWLPTAQNINPADSGSIDFAADCRRLKLPLLIHTGSEGATRNLHPEWNNPRALEPLLKTGATIIAAHCGSRSLPHETCHFGKWIDMLPDWPNLYGDTSSLFGLRPRKLIRALDRRLVADRLVHGSDWPVPNWPGWYWPGLSVQSVRRLSRIRNPLWRDVATKLAAGIPEASFTRGWDLISH